MSACLSRALSCRLLLVGEPCLCVTCSWQWELWMLVPEARRALHGCAEQAVGMEQAGLSKSWEMVMAVGIPVFRSLLHL